MSKTDDIHRAILAKAAQAPAPRAPIASGARPYVAEAGQRLAEGLREENQRLKAERANGMLVLRLDPKRVRATQFMNRDERAFLESDPSFVELKESLRVHGQEHPIRVRAVENDPSVDFEIIAGHRRHRACLALDAAIEGGFPLLGLVDSKAGESRDLVLKMYRENAERADLSPYEYGHMFQSWLDAKVFETQGELAAAVGLSDGSITSYLQVAGLPAEVLAAFGDPRTIAVRWTHDLSRALRRNAAAVRAAAVELISRKPRPKPEEVLRELAAFGFEKTKAPAAREESVKINGKVAFSLTRRTGRITVKFGKTIDRSFQKEVGDAIKNAAEELLSTRLRSK
jgi:ParB family chromosome partitioning protein